VGGKGVGPAVRTEDELCQKPAQADAARRPAAVPAGGPQLPVRGRADGPGTWISARPLDLGRRDRYLCVIEGE